MRDIELPNKEILDNYEEMAQGMENLLLKMTELEQLHRQKMEEKFISAYTRSKRMEQMAGLIFLLALIAATVYLARYVSVSASMVLSIFGFLFLAVNVKYTAYKPHHKRPDTGRPPRHYNNRHRSYNRNNDKNNEASYHQKPRRKS